MCDNHDTYHQMWYFTYYIYIACTIYCCVLPSQYTVRTHIKLTYQQHAHDLGSILYPVDVRHCCTTQHYNLSSVRCSGRHCPSYSSAPIFIDFIFIGIFDFPARLSANIRPLFHIQTPHSVHIIWLRVIL